MFETVFSSHFKASKTHFLAPQLPLQGAKRRQRMIAGRRACMARTGGYSNDADRLALTEQDSFSLAPLSHLSLPHPVRPMMHSVAFAQQRATPNHTLALPRTNSRAYTRKQAASGRTCEPLQNCTQEECHRVFANA